MTDHEDLIERSASLKAALLEFMKGRKYDRHVRKAIRERFGPVVVGDEGEVGNFFDHLLLQYRLPDGRTLVDHFVEAHPELPEREREMLLGWQDVVEGIFAIERREGEALILLNLVDEMTYRVRSNMGAAGLRPMRPGSFLITRLVPVDDEWLVSGYSSLLPASSEREVMEIARKLMIENPRLAFRNPEKLEQAWEMQRQERDDFVTFFGSDLVIIPSSELQERLEAYHRFRMYDVRDEEGKSPAERAQESYGFVPEIPPFDLPPDLMKGETVGVIYDEVEGFNMFPNLGVVAETFSDPERVADRRHREAVLEYLESRGLSPLPLIRLAERNPEGASQVFARILKRPAFQWEQDGEALLRRHKPDYFERAPLPSVIPVNESAIPGRMRGLRGETEGRKSERSGLRLLGRGTRSRR